MKILIPAAGQGSRFQQAGFTFPKPLIETHNHVPMIQRVIENLPFPEAEYIFLVRREHVEKYNIDTMLRTILKGKSKDVQVLIVDKLTEGAACTTLLAKELIDNDEELIMANSDQWIDWEPRHFLKFVREKNADGAITTFYACHSRWSFAKVDEETNLITEVAEKKPISTTATTGIYYFSKGSDFVKYAEQMIKKDIRTNGEFYVCPVFNELIGDGKRIYNYPVAEMLGMGTPEDLERYLRIKGGNGEK